VRQFTKRGRVLPDRLATYNEAYLAALQDQDFAILAGPRAELAQAAYADVRKLKGGVSGEVLVGNGLRANTLRGRIAIGLGVLATATLTLHLLGGSNAARPSSESAAPGPVAAGSDLGSGGYPDWSSDQLRCQPLSSMRVGQDGYTIGWSYFEEGNKDWIDPSSCWTPDVSGSSEIPVMRESDGFHIRPNAEFPMAPGSVADISVADLLAIGIRAARAVVP
jgi:hypothetical protein